MIITLADIKNGEYIDFRQAINNRDGLLEIALCKILYYPKWINIGPELNNDWYFFGVDQKRAMNIPPGYYSMCSLNEGQNKFKLSLNLANGLFTITNNSKERITLGVGLSKTLGFGDTPRGLTPGDSQTASNAHSLCIQKELCVHIDKISSNDNIAPLLGSTVLRTVPVEKAEYNSGSAYDFPSPIFKNLENGFISNMRISILDIHGSPLEIGYLSLTLEIRHSQGGTF